MNNPLKLQSFLQLGNQPELLQDLYGISHHRHQTFPNLILFKYSQLDSPMSEPITQEARGIILDESNNWQVVGRGFDKFFNYGEGHCSPLDWDTAKVHEKLDGSLCLLYEYNQHWNVATTGSPDASGKVLNLPELKLSDLLLAIKSPLYFLYRLLTHLLTYQDLFLLAYETLAGPLPNITQDNINTCYLFELMSPLNQVVIPHKDIKLVLLASRDRLSGKYLDANLPNIPKPREFPLTNIQDILESFKHIDGLSQEGFVVSDSLGNRVKVKHPQYVAMHHLKDKMGLKWLAKVVLTGESPEFLSVFPEYKRPLDIVKVRYETLVSQAEEVFSKAKNLNSQKDFALTVKDYPFSSILFSLRAKKTPSVKHWLAEEQHFNSALKLLNIED